MFLMVLLFPVLLVIGAAVTLIVVFRKNKNPEKIARIFSFVSLGLGVLCIVIQLCYPEYDGPGGIDYIGDAIVHGLIFTAVLGIGTLAYLCSAVVTTVFSVKAIRKKPDVSENTEQEGSRKKSARGIGIFSLILCWIYGVTVLGTGLTGILMKRAHEKSISVNVKEVTQVTDSDGDPAALVVFEVNNGSKREITFLSSIYAEVTQDGRTLSTALLPSERRLPDTEIERIKPGSTGVVRKAYKLRGSGQKIHIKLRTFGDTYTYVDGDYAVPKQ